MVGTSDLGTWSGHWSFDRPKSMTHDETKTMKANYVDVTTIICSCCFAELFFAAFSQREIH